MLKYSKNPAFLNFAKGGRGDMCPLPPAHMSLIRKDSWTLTFFIFIQFLHLLFLWLSNKHFLNHDVLARNKERISLSLFLLVLIISIRTQLFIHLTFSVSLILQNIWILPTTADNGTYHSIIMHIFKQKQKQSIIKLDKQSINLT